MFGEAIVKRACLGTLSHVGSGPGGGYAAVQVVVHDKPITTRQAVAEAVVRLPAPAWSALFCTVEGENAIGVPEVAPLLLLGSASRAGAVFAAAKLAGILATKRTAELIPLCHAVPLDGCTVTISPQVPLLSGACNAADDATNDRVPGVGLITIRCTVIAHGRTGVEMEAMVGASIAALTIYDMTKSASKGVTVEGVRLLHKSGGKSVYDATTEV